jgi:hypothetical protein
MILLKVNSFLSHANNLFTSTCKWNDAQLNYHHQTNIMNKLVSLYIHFDIDTTPEPVGSITNPILSNTSSYCMRQYAFFLYGLVLMDVCGNMPYIFSHSILPLSYNTYRRNAAVCENFLFHFIWNQPIRCFIKNIWSLSVILFTLVLFNISALTLSLDRQNIIDRINMLKGYKPFVISGHLKPPNKTGLINYYNCGYWHASSSRTEAVPVFFV